jgi:hypothetical protein
VRDWWNSTEVSDTGRGVLKPSQKSEASKTTNVLVALVKRLRKERNRVLSNVRIFVKKLVDDPDARLRILQGTGI